MGDRLAKRDTYFASTPLDIPKTPAIFPWHVWARHLSLISSRILRIYSGRAGIHTSPAKNKEGNSSTSI
jgi:hypothetical protein